MAMVGFNFTLAGTYSTGRFNLNDTMRGNYAGTVNIYVGLAPHRKWITNVSGIP